MLLIGLLALIIKIILYIYIIGFFVLLIHPNIFTLDITIDIDKNSSMTFRFDAGEIKDELYLQNQYDDIDAPHYLTYKHEENLSYI